MNKPANTTGRAIQCMHCAQTTRYGSSQVFRKLLFHFCLACWREQRESCNTHMQRVAA